MRAISFVLQYFFYSQRDKPGFKKQIHPGLFVNNDYTHTFIL